MDQVVTAMCFDDSDEAITLANDTPYGLAGSIWDFVMSARPIAWRQASVLDYCGSTATVFRTWRIPFGGYKQSGWGRENGWEGLEKYTELKSVLTLL